MAVRRVTVGGASGSNALRPCEVLLKPCRAAPIDQGVNIPHLTGQGSCF